MILQNDKVIIDDISEIIEYREKEYFERKTVDKYLINKINIHCTQSQLNVRATLTSVDGRPSRNPFRSKNCYQLGSLIKV